MLVCMGYPPRTRTNSASYLRRLYPPHQDCRQLWRADQSRMRDGTGVFVDTHCRQCHCRYRIQHVERKTPEVEKTAFIDDRTLDSSNLQQRIEAIAEVADVDEMLGHSTNIDKSKKMATTKRTGNIANKRRNSRIQAQPCARLQVARA